MSTQIINGLWTPTNDDAIVVAVEEESCRISYHIIRELGLSQTKWSAMYSWWSLASTGGAYICFQIIILYRYNSVNGHNLNTTYMSSFYTKYCGHTRYVLHVEVPSNTTGTSGCGIILMLPTNVDIKSASTWMFVVVSSETLSWTLIYWHIDCSIAV